MKSEIPICLDYTSVSPQEICFSDQLNLTYTQEDDGSVTYTANVCEDGKTYRREVQVVSLSGTYGIGYHDEGSKPRATTVPGLSRSAVESTKPNNTPWRCGISPYHQE